MNVLRYYISFYAFIILSNIQVVVGHNGMAAFWLAMAFCSLIFIFIEE
jgi:hypothetical protein